MSRSGHSGAAGTNATDATDGGCNLKGSGGAAGATWRAALKPRPSPETSGGPKRGRRASLQGRSLWLSLLPREDRRESSSGEGFRAWRAKKKAFLPLGQKARKPDRMGV